MSHPNCTRPNGHTCYEPSGRVCVEAECREFAGTHWGPYWCPEHDAVRLDRITASLEALEGDSR